MQNIDLKTTESKNTKTKKKKLKTEEGSPSTH